MSFSCWYTKTLWEKLYVKIGVCFTMLVLITCIISLINEILVAPLTNTTVSRVELFYELF